jgi:hypothetical protein
VLGPFGRICISVGLDLLIVAQKRTPVERLKRAKDLFQARSLIEALRIFDPDALLESYDDACAQGQKGWAAPFQRSLKEIGLSMKDV